MNKKFKRIKDFDDSKTYVDNRTEEEKYEARKEFDRGMSGLTRLDDSGIKRAEQLIQQRINALNEEKSMYGYATDININSYEIQQHLIDNAKKRLAIDKKEFALEYKKAMQIYKKRRRNLE